MGILNLTEDSFSDGALYLCKDKALKHAEDMIEQGASIIDIGAESTRPGAKAIPVSIELERVIPVLEAVKENMPCLVSIDTRKALVASAAISAGADIINDVSALQYDPQMTEVIAKHPDVKLILMHSKGDPETMQIDPQYEDLLAEIYTFFEERISFCQRSGIAKERLILDVGIGFGKTLEHNLMLLANLKMFHSLACPLLLGASRKSFINHFCPSPAASRQGGSLAAAMYAVKYEVDYIRVHDVGLHQQFFSVLKAISEQEQL